MLERGNVVRIVVQKWSEGIEKRMKLRTGEQTMNRAQQIEKMAKKIHGFCRGDCSNCSKCTEWIKAEQIYNMGFRYVPEKVYQTDGVRVYESEVKGIIYKCDSIDFDARAIGQSVFLMREEAEERAEK